MFQQIEDFSTAYEETRNQPIYVNLESEMSSNLQQEKEQIMKYQGKTIHKNKNAETWYTRYRMNGKQYYISAKTQKDCYNKLKKAIRQTALTLLSTPTREIVSKGITLLDWYNKWLTTYKRDVKESTLVDYKTMLKHIPLEIQNKALDRITEEEYVETIYNCKGTRQRQKIYEFLNAMLKKAKLRDLINKNPLELIDKPKHTKEHGQALNNAQQKQLIEVCKTIEYGDIMIVAMLQGLRRGEVLGLTIDNVDFENDKLTIDKAWKQSNQFTETKNEQSRRTMPLFAETKSILLKYKNVKHRIFDVSTKIYEGIIDEIKEKANIDKLKMKDMRSTFITRCKELNIPKHIIQAWVGHKIGSTVTDTVYTKHNDDVDYNYINIVNESKFYSNSTHEKK